jgi:hypothetical protein
MLLEERDASNCPNREKITLVLVGQLIIAKSIAEGCNPIIFKTGNRNILKTMNPCHNSVVDRVLLKFLW